MEPHRVPGRVVGEQASATVNRKLAARLRFAVSVPSDAQ